MDVVVIPRVGCGQSTRTQRPLRRRRSGLVGNLRLLGSALILLCCLDGFDAAAQSSPAASDKPAKAAQQSAVSRNSKGAPRSIIRAKSSHARDDATPPSKPAQPAATPSTHTVPAQSEKRYKVLDEFDRSVVTRYYGHDRDKTVVLLPDGQLGKTTSLVPTDEPFQPTSADELRKLLHDGPFAEYQVLQTEHYLIFYQSSTAFAQDSGRLLEELYRGLINAFNRNGIEAHESEFPLVAVIFATEQDFRKHKEVPPQVQAYYEFFTNRILFYQKSDRDLLEPKVAALLKPQTVAHEGTHQVLSNIGVQPRPCSWPLWLIEGLTEYCATTVKTKKGGIAWDGMGATNALHMATIRELDDPLANQVNAPDADAVKVAGRRPATITESLLLKRVLTPTDYAQAWALTHYLARQRKTEFVAYLKAMGKLPPFQPRSPEENLAEFRKFFSDDLAKLDKKVDDNIRRLVKKGGYDLLPYYTVLFAQSLGNGMIRRGAKVSQSPSVIESWVQEMTVPFGDVPSWEATPYPSQQRAFLAAQEWMAQWR
jgi:Protein of unknown function (DUF1570)